MRWIFLFVLLFLSSSAWAEQVKTIFNPFTNKPDYITRLDTGIQISVGSVNLPDAINCIWDVTISTNGNLTTTLVSCPSSGGTVCQNGVPIGLLLSLTSCQ